MKSDFDSYQDFFREEIYDKLVGYLLRKLGSSTVNELLGSDPLFTKRGVHPQFECCFNEFLSKNPRTAKTFRNAGSKTFVVKGICDQPLAFPVDVKDEALLVRENIHVPIVMPVDIEHSPAGKYTKHSALPPTQVLKGSGKGGRFVAPQKLVIHFKRGFAKHLGKTTETYDVNSSSEVYDLLYDVYKDRVAFAKCGPSRFEFVKRIAKQGDKHAAKREEEVLRPV